MFLQGNSEKRVPETVSEIEARIYEMVGVGGMDSENHTYDVFWKDCDPTHATMGT